MTLKKIDSTKKSNFVLNQLVEELSSDEYEVGDQLPTEGELAQLMGVSRGSVREALAALRLTGVITSRAGQGTHLNQKLSKAEGTLEEKALTVLRRDTSPEEMFEARATIEAPISALALKRMDNSDLENIKEILSQMSQAVASVATERYISLNKQFHLSIFQATKNKVLNDIMKSVLSYMEEDLWKEERQCYYEENQERFQKSLKIHKEIFSSLKNKDSTALSNAMKEHFSYLSGGNELEENEVVFH